jgi:poly(3-hydroxybutyrate) depolymerase
VVGGVSRHYKVFVPSSYDSGVPMRLIFVFHGLGGNGDLIRSHFSFEAEANGQALFVYPDGLPVQGGTGWSSADATFFDVMLSEISADYCVDAARVFATGHSYGGYMSNLLGCARPNVLRAIAPASGGLAGDSCGGPVAAWLIHGSSDGTVPQSEGISARNHWITVNQCGATTTPTGQGECVSYDGCSPGHPVTWCSFNGGHFPLPGYTKQAIWDFFAAL